LLTFL
jgi:hypothetical protein